jgi:deoxyribonuclease-4
MATLKIGVHLSLGEHPGLSLLAAHGQGARCLQVFCSSPAAWKPPVLSDRKMAELAEARLELNMDPLVIHAIYLINLASSDPLLAGRSKTSLIAALEAGEQLGATAVITHLGSHAGAGYEQVADQVASGLSEIVETASGDVALALENSAGSGGILGADLGELADLINRAGMHRRLRVVLDTAHLCAAGWDFCDPASARRLVDKIGETFGLDRLVAIHANDSKRPVGSRRDRHANVGEGFIGAEGFTRLLENQALRSVPWILETPDLDTRLPDGDRFASLRRLRDLAEQTPIAQLPS